MSIAFAPHRGNPSGARAPRFSDDGTPPTVPFVMLPYAVAQDQRLDFRARCVAMALVHFSYHRPECWPSNASLAAWVGTSEGSVRRDLDALEAAGHIRRQAVKPHPGNPTGRLILLCWRVDPAAAPAPPPAPQPDPGPSLSLATVMPAEHPPCAQLCAPPLRTAMGSNQDCQKTDNKTVILHSRAAPASRDAGAREEPTNGATAVQRFNSDHDGDPGRDTSPCDATAPWDVADESYTPAPPTVGPVGCNDARAVEEVLWLANQLFGDTSVPVLCRQWLADTSAARVNLALQRADAVKARRPTRYIQALIDDPTFGQPRAPLAAAAGGPLPYRETPYEARMRREREMLAAVNLDDINL